jgi:micrococcal nuclease
MIEAAAVKHPVRTYEFARVANVVDGDTIDVEIDLGFCVKVNIRCRLARINAPEMHNPDGTQSLAGFAAREFLRNRSQGHPCQVVTGRTDPYGRYIAEVTIGDRNLSDAMLTGKHAERYLGLTLEAV